MKNYSVTLVLSLLVLFGCCKPEEPSILYIPQFGTNQGESTGNTRMVIGPESTIIETVFYSFNPILSGLKSNENNVTGGDTLEYTVLGSVLTIIVDHDEINDIVSMHGSFDDGVSYTDITFYNDTNTFDYEQYIIIREDPENPPSPSMGEYVIAYSKAQGVTINEDLSYHFYMELYSVQPYSIGVFENDIFFGDINDGRIAGIYLHGMKSPDPQPELPSIDDPHLLAKTDFLAYFTNLSEWDYIDDGRPDNIFLFWNETTEQFYIDPIGASGLTDFNIQSVPECPWTPLPR